MRLRDRMALQTICGLIAGFGMAQLHPPWDIVLIFVGGIGIGLFWNGGARQ